MKLKHNAYLINAVREGIIDETALIKVLERGLIAGAALDTFTQESLPTDSNLLKLDNIIVTPM